MRIKLIGLIAAFVLGGLSFAANAVPVSVFLSPSSQAVAFPGSFGVDLFWNFTGDATLGGGTDISWDPGAFSLVSIVFDSNPNFDPFFTRPGDTGTPGLIDGLATGSFNGLAGTGPLYIATITFNTLAEGSFAINLAQDNGVAGPFISLTTFGPYADITFTGATVDVAAIPLPAAAWLMIGGLGALLGFRRKV